VTGGVARFGNNPGAQPARTGLEEGVSGKLLIYAAQMIASGISPVNAAEGRAHLADYRRPQAAKHLIVTAII